MEIGNIKVNLPKIKSVQTEINKPLANLNEPIKDSFESSIDTRFRNLEYKPIYEMAQDLGDKDFSKKVKKAIAQLPNGIAPDRFKQNEYEPKKEFSLVVTKKSDNYNERLTNMYYDVGNTFTFDAKTAKMISKTHKELVIEKNGEDKEAFLVTKTEDLKNNIVVTKKEKYNEENNELLLQEQRVVKKDKNGKMLREEVMTPSQIKGMYDIKYTYANGKTKDVVKSTIDPKTGIKTIKKDMKSEDGTRTEFLYEDDPTGNRIIDYKITNKDGKILMKNSQSFEILGENHFISSKNGRKYEIKTDEAQLTVKDMQSQKEASIQFEKKCKGKKNIIIETLKKIPGEELFETIASTKKLRSCNDALDSYFSPLTKKIKVGNDMFVFLHELGHAKDAQNQKGFFDAFRKSRLYTDNKDIQNQFFEERETFNKYHTDAERDNMKYFVQSKGHYAGELGGFSEAIAETNALVNTYTDEKVKSLSPRTQYLQQHFPKTIAKICDAMNWKEDLNAIEYYGT